MCLKKSAHLVGVPGDSTNSDPDYFNEHGELVYMHANMVYAKAIDKKKHPIQFPISVNLEKVKNLVKGHCSTVLLKADTGDDLNLLNSTSFDKIIRDRSLLQPTSLRMEAYGNNTEFQVLEKFHTFLRWKGKIYRQLFYITNVNASPNLLSRDGCYTLGLLKHCYLVDTLKNCSKQPKTNLEQCKKHGDLTQYLTKELMRRSCLIPLNSLSTKSNFKASH